MRARPSAHGSGWHPRRPWQSLLFALPSVAVTAVFVLALVGQDPPPRAVPRAEPLILIRLALPPPQPPAENAPMPEVMADAPVPAQPRRGPRRPGAAAASQAITASSVDGAAAPRSDAPTAAAPVEAAASSPAASSTTSPPLDLRLSTQAARAAKGDVRRMAASSGVALHDAPVSKQEQLAGEVAKAGKPDCLRKGESLLSIITIPWEVMNDQCR